MTPEQAEGEEVIDPLDEFVATPEIDAAPEQNVGGPPRAGRRRLRRFMAGGVVVLLAFAGAAYWYWAMLGSRLDQVLVYTDLDPLACEGTEAVVVDDERRATMPGIEIRPGLRCVYEFHVENRGADGIEVESVTFPFAGPEAGAGLRAVALYPVVDGAAEYDIADKTDDYLAGLAAGGNSGGLAADDPARDDPVIDDRDLDGRSARFVVDRTVEGGESVRFRVRLEYQDGCSSDGSRLLLRGPFAQVNLSAGQRSGGPGGAFGRLVLVGTAESSCDG